MPPYVTIETYLPCSDTTVKQTVNRYVRMLSKLGHSCAGSGLLATEMGWDEDSSWFGPVWDPPCPIHNLSFAGRELLARAGVGGWSVATNPHHHDHWLSLELGFETESDEQYLVTDSVFAPQVAKFLPGVGRCLWQVMCAFGAEFPDVPTYCSFEGWEGDTWEALECGGTNLWSFDAALVPPAMAERFTPTPSEYEMERTLEGIALARRELWHQLPWRELV